MADKIIIIGGGIAGLSLALGFKKHNVPFHVYERDELQGFRAQGYRIRIAGPSIEALEYLFDAETWSRFELINADTRLGPIPMVNAVTAEPDQSTTNRPPPPPMGMGRKPYTIDRPLFRELLIRQVGEENITFGQVFERYEQLPGSIRAHFANGSVVDGRFLVGADGAHSRIRQQYLPHHIAYDTEGRGIYGKTLLTPELEAKIAPSIIPRMSAIKDRTRSQVLSMLSERITFPNRSKVEEVGLHCPADYVYWVMASQPEGFGMTADESPSHSPAEAEQLALHVSKDWHPSIRCIIEEQQPGQTAILRINSCPPELPTWEPNGHMTLLGDAIHLMGPTAGSGANTALRDAHLLCKLIVEEGCNRETVAKYETEMREYASDAIAKSWQGGKNMFGQKSWDEIKP